MKDMQVYTLNCGLNKILCFSKLDQNRISDVIKFIFFFLSSPL